MSAALQERVDGAPTVADIAAAVAERVAQSAALQQAIVAVDAARARTRRRTVGALLFLAGVTVGLVTGVALIPDQPDRIIVPVDQPANQVVPPQRGLDA